VAAKVEGLQAAGQAAVLLLPASSLIASADNFYLPLRDKVYHERSNPLHRTALASCQHTRTAARPLASRRLGWDGGNFSRATVYFGRTWQHPHRQFHQLVHVLVTCVPVSVTCEHFFAALASGSAEENRANFACNQPK